MCSAGVNLPIVFVNITSHLYPFADFISLTRWSWMPLDIKPVKPIIFTLFIELSRDAVDAMRV